MEFGINLGFASKRWPEPEAWARLVREDMGLDLVQFSFDLLDPWWPDPIRMQQAERVRQAAESFGIRIHSAQVGLASYTFNGLLHHEPELRRLAVDWWHRSIDVAAAIGARAVGGPLGALTTSSHSVEGERERIYQELLETVAKLSDRCAEAGLEALLVEPTPQAREIPGDLTEAERLVTDLKGKGRVPVRYVLDIGHALYQPLYGPDARLEQWLEAIGAHVGVLHVQNTDFQSDSHWGWPDPRGVYDVAAFAASVREAGLDAVPVFLEVFYPFELGDQRVRDNIVSSVMHCRRELGLG